MRIDRLEIRGFGPFRDLQTIDFERYTGEGIFLIAGRTGAGKSSILDAVCFALYGSAPRYDDSEKRLRSDYADVGDPTEVALEFGVGRDRWRIERRPQYERPKLRGEGTTTEPSAVTLFRKDGGEWVGVAAREREVASRIADIVGMNGEQFQQVILLAQGRFARFLLAKNDERQRLLRSLFGSRRFEDYERTLDERRKVAEAEIARSSGDLQAILDQVEDLLAEVRARDDEKRAEEAAEDAADSAGSESRTGAGDGDAPETPDAPRADADVNGACTNESADETDPADVDARIGSLDAAGERAEEHAAVARRALADATAARDAAEAAHEKCRRTAELQERRDAARARIGTLDAERDALDAARRELAAARRAMTVTSAIDALARAHAERERRADAAENAHQAWAEERHAAAELHGADDPALPVADAPPDALDDFDDACRQRIGRWEPLRDREAQLDERAERIERLRAQRTEHDERIARLQRRGEEIPVELDEERTHRDAAIARAATGDSARDRIDELGLRLRAAREVAPRTDAYAAAEQAAQQTARERDAADHVLSDLQRRRLAGYSGELAASLTPGEPCTVCGSTAHPSPAEPADDRVTDEEIDRASETRTTAAGAHDQAVEARQRAYTELRAVQERADGRTVEDLEVALGAAREQRDDAERARGETAEREKKIGELDAERARLDADRTAALEARSADDSEIVTAEQLLAAEREAIDAARGPFDSVAARIETVKRRAATARACADAARERERAAAAADDAASARDAALAEAEFASADAAQLARRSADEIAGLEKRVTDADASRASAERDLAELTELELPDERVDVDATAAALAAARSVHDDALERVQATRQTATALASAAQRAHAALARVHDVLARANVITRLAHTVAGRAPNELRMNLETFVLAAELEEIVQAANLRLAEMSDNRYELRHSDARAHRNAASGLGIEVFDAFTGRARPPHSLSGGETFLASLALALGLAEVVTNRAGGLRLDTLFIDEGFGSLDAETLDVAMRTIDDLRQGGRTIGLISHVESMKEQILTQLQVRRARGGWSVVDQH